MTTPTVLLVEDEESFIEALQVGLSREGYRVEVARDGFEALDRFDAVKPDLVLLDVNLPGRDGYAICRELRSRSELPILMLTARVEEIDRILGLELGADDYVCKPFSPREVMARVRALLRRVHGPAGHTPSGRLRFDDVRHEALLDGQPLALTPVEYRLLHALAARPGSVLSRARLIDHAYADHRVVSERTMDSHLKNLRRKLQATGDTEATVEGVYGVGYRLKL